MILRVFEISFAIVRKDDPEEPNASEIVKVMAHVILKVCRNLALADALPTTFGNRIQTPEDVQQATLQTEQFPEILSAVIICRDKIRIRWRFEMKLIK